MVIGVISKQLAILETSSTLQLPDEPPPWGGDGGGRSWGTQETKYQHLEVLFLFYEGSNSFFLEIISPYQQSNISHYSDLSPSFSVKEMDPPPIQEVDPHVTGGQGWVLRAAGVTRHWAIRYWVVVGQSRP